MGGRYRKLNFVIFVVWSVLITGMWVVECGRKYCLEPAEIASFVCLQGWKDSSTIFYGLLKKYDICFHGGV